MQPKTRLWILLIVALIIFSASACLAKVVYVKTTGLDTNDGLSWDTAKKTVAAGINASASGDDIWVAAGTYVERITLKAGVGLYGGFAGAESSRGDRNWNTNVTILDGSQGGSVVTGSGGATTTTVIDGFTIRNGKASTYGTGGGGIYCSNSSPAISNNTFTGNTTLYNGGGIYCMYSSPAISNNTFTGNSAKNGGAISCYGTNASPSITDNTMTGNTATYGAGIYCYASSPTITGNTIKSNTAPDSYGGAVYCYNASPQISNNTFDSNAAGWGGAVYCEYNSKPNIADNTFTKNTADSGFIGSRGGAIYCTASSASITGNSFVRNITTGSGGAVYLTASSSATVSGNTFLFNRTADVMGSACNGGAMFSDSSSPTIKNNRFIGNSVYYIYGYGGAVYLLGGSPVCSGNYMSGNSGGYGGGAVSCNTSTASIDNNVIVANGAQSGGGIYCVGSPTIANNTIVGNETWRGAKSGSGGISCGTYSPTIVNNIIAFNSVGIAVTTGAPVLRNNCVYGNGSADYLAFATVPTGSNGNISADPLLVSTKYGNLHIQPTSPCKDNGDNSVLQSGWLDMDGLARILPDGGTVDIGADESDGTEWTTPTPTIARVTPTGSDANDGSAWDDAHAKRTLQGAIDPLTSQGGEVWVKAGVYTDAVSLLPFAYVYGGFNGSESSRSARNWVVNNSLLDVPTSYFGSAVSVSSCGAYSALNGFTVRRGRGRKGGGLYVFCSSPEITNNTIMCCSATNQGGGIYCEGSSSLIANNVITLNASFSYATTTGIAGGIYLYCSDASVVNNTILNNSATNSSETNGGGGVYSYWSTSAIANNIISGNSSGVLKLSTDVITFSHNCVYGNSGTDYTGFSPVPTGTNGNISLDPKIVDMTFGNMHIQTGSPCLDAGDNSFVTAGSKDMDLQNRTLPGDGTVDIGADESDGTSWPLGPQQILRVSPTGNDANDGSTWDDAHAKGTIQAALDAAQTRGGEVWVKAGGYNGCVLMPPYVDLYGSFSGTETDRAGRDWRANPTILDGLQQGTAISSYGNAGKTVEGFVIQNSKSGISASSAWVRNNTVIGANGTGISGGGSTGGIIGNKVIGCIGTGISCSGTSAFTVCNNWVIGNSGNGVRSYNSTSIANNTIVANGVGLYSGDFSVSPSPAITNNIIAFNDKGVSSYVSNYSAPLKYNCVFGNATNYDKIPDQTGQYSNISLDPLFVDRANGDYHLTGASPCINKGLNTAPGLPIFDFDGEGRIFGGTVDIGADEYWSSLLSANETKKAPEGAVINLSGAIVSGKFTDFFYIESDDRSGGIRVDKTGFSADEDSKVIITGKVKTNDSGERYIAADSVAPDTGTLDIKPILLSTRDTGGGEIGLQDGASSKMLVGPAGATQYVWNEAIGVNNIGLLVSVIGNVTFAGTGLFYLDDGSKMDDGSGNYGIKVLAAGLTFPDHGLVKVTGIVSCEKNGDKLIRLLRVRKQDDIVSL